MTKDITSMIRLKQPSFYFHASFGASLFETAQHQVFIIAEQVRNRRADEPAGSDLYASHQEKAIDELRKRFSK